MKLNKILFYIVLLITGLSTLAFFKTAKKSKNNTQNEEYLNFQKIIQSVTMTEEKVYTKSFDIQSVLDRYVQQYSEIDGFTGIHLTVKCPLYNHGQTTTFTSGLQKKFGTAVSNDSLFQIGSIRKSFVSVVILQLEAEGWKLPNGKGKFTIENAVKDFFPGEYPEWENITVKELLNMTAGIVNYSDAPSIREKIWENPYYHFLTDELLNSVKDSKLSFSPGEGFDYSNSNYVVAGKIIEKITYKITHKSLEEEIKTRIIQPLQMKHTFYIPNIPKDNVASDQVKNLMSGYYTGVLKEPYFTKHHDIIDYSMSWANAAAGITSNVSDLAPYAAALFGKAPNGLRLLPEDQLKEFISLVDENGRAIEGGINSQNPRGYGLGIYGTFGELVGFGDTIMYGHNGLTKGFWAIFYYIPEKDIFFAYAINTSAGADLNDPIFDFVRENCLTLDF